MIPRITAMGTDFSRPQRIDIGCLCVLIPSNSLWYCRKHGEQLPRCSVIDKSAEVGLSARRRSAPSGRQPMRSGVGKISARHNLANETSLSSSSLFFGSCFIFIQRRLVLLPPLHFRPRRLRTLLRFLLNR